MIFKRWHTIRSIAFALLMLGFAFSLPSALHAAGADEQESPGAGWLKDFHLQADQMTATGRNRYFILEPGYQLVLEGEDTKLTITVLGDVRVIDGIETRVVEEREEEDGALIEISKNFFALNKETKDLFYFGEDVDIYKNGEIVGHEGAWLAGRDNAKAGMFLPGHPAVGMKYYQEQAPGVALDRGEIIDTAATLKTPAGTFTNCLKVQETNDLKPREKEIKIHAPGIGLIQDEDLLLIRWGFVSDKR